MRHLIKIFRVRVRVRVRVIDTLNGDKSYVNPHVNNQNPNPNVMLSLSQSYYSQKFLKVSAISNSRN